MFKWTDYEKNSRCFVSGIVNQEVAHIDIKKMTLIDTITDKKFVLSVGNAGLEEGKKEAEELLVKHWKETQAMINRALDGIK